MNEYVAHKIWTNLVNEFEMECRKLDLYSKCWNCSFSSDDLMDKLNSTDKYRKVVQRENQTLVQWKTSHENPVTCHFSENA